MHYVLADDSVPFDGFTPSHRPLGGTEKGVIHLAAALAARGHAVTVLNRVTYGVDAQGVQYRPLDEGERPAETDVLIAVRRPSLLGAVRKASHRLLWVVAPPDYLAAPANAPLWPSFQPTVLFVSPLQSQSYGGGLPCKVWMPGVDVAFQPPDMESGGLRQVPAHALVTTHPLHGLTWLIEVWRRLIHPQLPEARLMVYSALLSKGLRGEEIAPDIQAVLARVKAASGAHVVVVEPVGDPAMAQVYRTSRVHLYPGHQHDLAAWTLAESQACGVPAVARAVGGVETHIINGQTGFIVPDAAAFANVAVELLRNDDVHASFSTAAGDVSRRRTWDMAAADLENIVAGS